MTKSAIKKILILLLPLLLFFILLVPYSYVNSEFIYDTYLTFYVDDVQIDVEQENVDNYLYYSFVMPSKDTTVVCKLVSVSPPPTQQ